MERARGGGAGGVPDAAVEEGEAVVHGSVVEVGVRGEGGVLWGDPEAGGGARGGGEGAEVEGDGGV